jgi:hypothetical protein
MNNRKNLALTAILLSLVGVMAAGDVWASRVSIGLGVHSGGNFFALGVNSGGHRHHCHVPPARFCRPCPPPVVFAPPVVCAPPVVYAPPPVVCAPVVVTAGRWVEREERVWIEGCWLESVDAYGRRCKIWQPGRWEIRRIREWVR